MGINIHPSASVHRSARLGDGVRVWDASQIRERVTIGAGTIIGRNVYVDAGVTIGANCKIQNNALIYAPAVLEDGVFVGPGAVLTNDKYPRAVNPDGTLKAVDDWESQGVTLRYGSSVGAGAVILGGVEVGEWAMVAAGSVVTKHVSTHALVRGVPAKFVKGVDETGR